jgi:hypothetical protein
MGLSILRLDAMSRRNIRSGKAYFGAETVGGRRGLA